MDPPLLLIDIDGVISLFGFDAAQPPPGRFLLVDGIPHFLSADAADLIGGLQEHFELTRIIDEAGSRERREKLKARWDKA